jgi:hypothetical protein
VQAASAAAKERCAAAEAASWAAQKRCRELDERVAELEAELRTKEEAARLDQLSIKRLEKSLAACREGAADEVKDAIAKAERAESRARDINHAAEVHASSLSTCTAWLRESRATRMGEMASESGVTVLSYPMTPLQLVKSSTPSLQRSIILAVRTGVLCEMVRVQAEAQQTAAEMALERAVGEELEERVVDAEERCEALSAQLAAAEAEAKAKVGLCVDALALRGWRGKQADRISWQRRSSSLAFAASTTIDFLLPPAFEC